MLKLNDSSAAFLYGDHHNMETAIPVWKTFPYRGFFRQQADRGCATEAVKSGSKELLSRKVL